MSFSLIICTFQRRNALLRLLDALQLQTLYPDEIIIVDASFTRESEIAAEERQFRNLKYFFVDEPFRGLTKQRNYGISKVSHSTDFICFFDDDIIPSHDYFQKLIATYDVYPQALGVGGYIASEISWKYIGKERCDRSAFSFDGWQRKEPSRFVIRKFFGLDSNRDPGFSSGFSHGRSVGFLPPSGKIYEVEQLMGGVSSFRKAVFDTFKFSHYFEGYGLYEDADFCLRVAKSGKLYLNTGAIVEHHHAASGRPNQYHYGKMVVRNGYFVWRVKNPTPSVKDKFKWHSITILLTLIRFTNIAARTGSKQAFTEAVGRLAGWFGILFYPPKEKTESGL